MFCLFTICVYVFCVVLCVCLFYAALLLCLFVHLFVLADCCFARSGSPQKLEQGSCRVTFEAPPEPFIQLLDNKKTRLVHVLFLTKPRTSCCS